MVGRSFSAWTGLSPFSAIARWKKSCRDGGDRAADLGAEGPGGGGGAAHSSKSLAQKGVWAGRGRHPGTAKCVSWTRIQGNCASPHSVCSEANAFLSYCLCRRLVVGTPFISSLGERPRCFESGCGRLDSRGRKEPGGSTSESPGGRKPGQGHAAQGVPSVQPSWLLRMPPCAEGKRVLMEGPWGRLPVREGSECWRSQFLLAAPPPPTHRPSSPNHLSSPTAWFQPW